MDTHTQDGQWRRREKAEYLLATQQTFQVSCDGGDLVDVKMDPDGYSGDGMREQLQAQLDKIGKVSCLMKL
jgi:hypothetical protein